MTSTNQKNSETAAKPELKKNARFYFGMAFLILSFITPLFIPLVLKLPFSAAVKGTISTALLFGGPEVFLLIAAAVLGKETFRYFIDRIKSVFRIKRPTKPVGKVRYIIGLIMFLLPTLVSIVEVNYAPAQRIYGDYLMVAGISWNVIFIASFFVLGADFWDKFRSLFIYNAYAVFPDKNNSDSIGGGSNL